MPRMSSGKLRNSRVLRSAFLGTSRSTECAAHTEQQAVKVSRGPLPLSLLASGCQGFLLESVFWNQEDAIPCETRRC